jgi:transposase
MAILFVGIDLAKNVFALHGVDEHGKAVLVRPSVQRGRLHQLVAALPPCTIGMERARERTTGPDSLRSTTTPCG